METPQASGTLGAATDVLSMSIIGMGSVGFQVSGTWVGVLEFEGCMTGDYLPLSVAATNNSAGITSTATNGAWIGSAAGLRLARVRFSSYTSGSANVSIQGSTGAIIVEPGLTLQFDASAAPLLYLGEAVVGASAAASVWRITRFDTTTGVAQTWAGGTPAFAYKWTDRASLSYA